MNPEEAFKKHVTRCISVREDVLDEFYQVMIYKESPKKVFLLKQREICKYEYFFVKGCARVFYIDTEGTEIILYFATENWWISDLDSFENAKPSELYIELLEDSEVLLLSREKKNEILQKYPEFETFFRQMLQKHVVQLQRRLIHTVLTPARERYLEFIQRYPDIQKRVPQHFIAAYLGITPVFLSKIRASLLKE